MPETGDDRLDLLGDQLVLGVLVAGGGSSSSDPLHLSPSERSLRNRNVTNSEIRTEDG